VADTIRSNCRTGADPVPFGPTATCAQNLSVMPGLFEALTSDTARRILERERSGELPPSLPRSGPPNGEIEQKALGAPATCPAGPQRDLLRAFAASWRGFVEHYEDDDRWRDDLNLSDQLFAACVKAKSGTDLGARCATGIETNGRWRRAWGS
jgi:hypothetical protein